MNRQAFNNTLGAVGMLFDGEDPSSFRYLGCCFSLLEPDVFMTAAHCVEGIPIERLRVNHAAGIGTQLLSGVRSVEVVSECDMAVFRIDELDRRWAMPFRRLKYVADLGEEVCALGYPEDRLSAGAPKQTLRIFRGIVQRPLLYERAERRYSAFELSFSCPPGLSGGPLFSAHDPRTVMGVVTENFETYSMAHEDIEVTSSGHPTQVTKYRQVITYGIAANIFYAIHAIENVIGRKLPDPAPVIISRAEDD